MEPADWDREMRIQKMRQQWRDEIPHFIGRDPLKSVPYKRGPLPSKIDPSPT